jgi:ABC-type polysaccharide/polyol phosphate export permease
VVFFFDAVAEWGAGNGQSFFVYLMVGMVGLNFLVELAVNMLLSPVVVRLLDFRKKA